MRNGERKTEIDPDYEHRYRQFQIETSPHTEWRNDPTYNLRKTNK